MTTIEKFIDDFNEMAITPNTLMRYLDFVSDDYLPYTFKVMVVEKDRYQKKLNAPIITDIKAIDKSLVKYNILFSKKNLVQTILQLDKDTTIINRLDDSNGVDASYYLPDNNAKSYKTIYSDTILKEVKKDTEVISLSDKINLLEMYVNDELVLDDDKIKTYNKRDSVFNTKRVVQLNREGDIINTYNSYNAAGATLGLRGNLIQTICRNKKGMTGGFSFRYEEDMSTFNKEEYKAQFAKRETIYDKYVDKYTIDGIYLETFENVKAASIDAKGQQGNIAKCCNGEYKKAYGFIWKWTDDTKEKVFIPNYTKEETTNYWKSIDEQFKNLKNKK